MRLQNKQETEEINSTLWFEILQNLHRFEPKDDNSFSIWAFKIARTSINDYFRKKLRLNKIEIFTDTAEDIISNEKELDDFVSQLDSETLKDAIAKLSPAYQSCIIMRFYNDMKNKEIAEILGISEKTVASNIVRGLENLREIYSSTQ